MNASVDESFLLSNGEILVLSKMKPKPFKKAIMEKSHRLYLVFRNQLGDSGKTIERDLKALLGGSAVPYSTTGQYKKAIICHDNTCPDVATIVQE